MLPLVGAFALLPAVAGGFDMQQIKCEEAVAHLDKCCPGFMPSAYNCDDFGGCGAPLDIDISQSQSECIRNLSCDEIRADGWCETTVVPPKVCR